MGFFSRLLGRCATPLLEDASAWRIAEGTLELDLAKVRALETPGAAIRIEGDGLPERILVVHGTDDAFHAFPNRCKHAGRRMDPLPGSPQIECCSVGRSTYDYTGHRLSGSAEEDLDALEVTRAGETLKIALPAPAAS